MCDTCGCNVTPGNEHLVRAGGRHGQTEDGRATIKVLANLLSENEHQAAHNREHWDRHGVLAVNLMSSPGAGKTSLLEATIDALGQDLGIAVIEGDLETENDAERIRAKGIPAIQIATGSACHLDAHMVHDVQLELELQGVDLLFIENVGNLVCPASFDLGQHRNVTLISAPEGDDKPAKYPVMFRTADLVLCTKADLLPWLTEFDPSRAETHVRRLASEAPFHVISTRDPDSLAPWLTWLREELVAQRARAAHGQTIRPAIQGEGPGRARIGSRPDHVHSDHVESGHAHAHHHHHAAAPDHA